MTRTRTIPALFAAILLANYAHCATEAATGIGRIHEFAAQASLPLHSPPQNCDHEFGCICRGAIVAPITNSDVLRNADSTWIVCELSEVSIAIDRTIATPLLRWSLAMSQPRSALELRALLASFLI